MALEGPNRVLLTADLLAKQYTRVEISHIEAQTGLKFAGFTHIDATAIPIFLRKEHNEQRWLEMLDKARLDAYHADTHHKEKTL
jgi:hypothetical protein